MELDGIKRQAEQLLIAEQGPKKRIRVRDDQGRELSTTFQVERTGEEIKLTIFSQGGAAGRKLEQEPTFRAGAVLLLSRLGATGARLDFALLGTGRKGTHPNGMRLVELPSINLAEGQAGALWAVLSRMKSQPGVRNYYLTFVVVGGVSPQEIEQYLATGRSGTADEANEVVPLKEPRQAEPPVAPPLPPAWLVMAFGEERQYGGNRGYEDEVNRLYRYDSFVPNSKRIREGDLLIVRGPDCVLGVAQIQQLLEFPTEKEFQRCPKCETTRIKSRQDMKPRWRCECGAEFDEPLVTRRQGKRYEAHFGGSFLPPPPEVPISIEALRRACPRYNAQHAMQRFDFSLLLGDARQLESMALQLVGVSQGAPILPETAMDNGFVPSGNDTRSIVERQVRERRGQKEFRDALLRQYEMRCAVSGCTLVDVLEAAHISPYRGLDDNDIRNGLLLRADLHTLFDLDLLAVEPRTRIVHFHPRVLAQAEYAVLDGRSLASAEPGPSEHVLEWRWKRFLRLQEAGANG